MNDEPILAFDNLSEPDFPGDYDIVHGQHRFRPENNDIDLYQFELQTDGALDGRNARRTTVQYQSAGHNADALQADG